MHTFASRSRSINRTKLLVLLPVVLAVCLPCFSQVNLGRIDGTVTDQSGGVIAGATVTVLDVARGVPRAVTTDQAGAYAAPNLIPGTYSVRAEANGFVVLEQTSIEVGVGQDVRVDCKLQVGQQTQTVTVTGEVPQINTTNAQLGGTIENQTAVNLPVIGRNFVALQNYAPGMMEKPGSGGGPSSYTNGLRGDYTVFVFDGLPDTNSLGTAEPLNLGYIAGGPDESVIVNEDAIQEVSMVENPKAEYGLRPGAQVNLGLRSGTNELHGTAFAEGRDTGLDAKNFFFPTKAPAALEQFGATFGGPIKKDKVFYYVGYEGQRYNIGNPKTITVPTTAPGAGSGNSLPDAIADMNAHGSPISPLSLALAGCSSTGVCTPNAGLFSNNLTTTSFPVDFPDIGRSDNGLAKFDYHINDKNNVNLDFFRGIGTIIAPVGSVTQQYWDTPLLGSVAVGRLVWSWIPNSTWVNEVRTGWDYSLQEGNASPDCLPDSGAPNYASLGFVSGSTVCGFPDVTISGFGSPTLGDPEGILARSLNYTFSDNVSYTHGDHLIKFGGMFRQETVAVAPSQQLSKGTIAFGPATGTSLLPGYTSASPNTALEDFLAGQPASESLQVGNLLREGAFHYFAGYIQDDWRVRSKLTLNLGLRYEYETPFTERNNLLVNFVGTGPTGLLQQSGTNLYKDDAKNFGPRFGLAYDVTGKGTTVVRAAFGIMYYNPVATEFISYNGAIALQAIPSAWNFKLPNGTLLTTPGGTAETASITITNFPKWAAGQSVFGSYVSSSGTCGEGGATPPCKISGIPQYLILPELLYWNFGIQHALTKSTSLDVSYVGNHGQHGLATIDANQPSPVGVIPAGTTLAALEQAARPYTVNGQYPFFSQIIYSDAYQKSNYDGLQASLKQRLSHGLTFMAGYTFSHALDMGTSEVGETLPQNSLNPTAEYGNGGADVRHRFTIEGTYTISGRKSPAQMLEGWQISSAAQIMTGFAFSPIDATDDVTGTGEAQDRWDLIGTPKDFSGYGGLTPIPCFGATGSSFAKVAACGKTLPQACINAATNNVPNGPGGSTGLAQLNKYGCYMSGNSVIVPPAQGTFGTMSRDALFGKGFREWDFTIMKNWTFKERYSAQFRAEFFNLLNSVEFATPSGAGASLASPGTFGTSLGNPDIINNNPIIGTGDARRIQLGLRLQF